MTPERWKQIEAIFGGALDLAESERAAFVAHECGDDRALEDEVRGLLASSSEASASMHETVAAVAGQFAGATARSHVGKRVGPYRLGELLGEGGMGVVYLARRDDAQYEHEVAIKILPYGLGSPQAIARFRDERQILAALEHPGIVRLLDGGTTDDGLPYLVMEKVEGVPLTRFAGDKPLRTRVALVRAVCFALQYAHGKLVVHRDIKPSNILVGPDGVAKLLDFGIAKLIDPDASVAREAKTRTGVALLTPEYASPEQARGEPVSVATDVYSLGAVLYHVLAGQPPQRPTGGPLEVLRMICEVDPPRPSTVAPEELRREIAGDLDNIVMKALHKDAERRYTSVEQLADDLGRYLDGLPVIARTATLGYRAGKFARRHRGKLALAALVVGALTTTTVISVLQARRADAAAARARKRFDDVRHLANSLLFEIDEALRDVAGTTHARELAITRALTYLDGLAAEATNDPRLARELAVAYMKIGDIQGNPYDPNIGQPAAGLGSYAKASALLARLDPADPAVARDRLAITFGTGLIYHMMRDTAKVRSLLSEALAASERAPGLVDPVLAARAYLALAFDEKEANDVAASERHTDAGLALVAAWDPKSDRARYWRAAFLIRRADVAARVGDPDAAVENLREIVALQATLATEHPTSAKYRREHAYSLLLLAIATSGVGDSRLWVAHTNDLATAESSAREATAIFERIATDDAADADAKMNVAALRTSLALVLARRSPSSPEVLAAFDAALAAFDAIPSTLRDSSYGRDNEYIAHCGASRSLALAGRRDDALARATKGLSLAESPFAKATCESLVADTARTLGDPATAIAHLESVIATLQPMLAGSDTSPLIGLVDALDRLAELQPAEACRRRAEALSAWRSWSGRSTPYLARRLAGLEHASCPMAR